MLNTEGLIEHPTPAPYPFGPPDVASILEAGLAEHPEQIALIDSDRTWTWTELDVAVAKTASGIAPDELMWFALGNCAEQIIGTLATFRAGGIWVGKPSAHPRSEHAALEERLGPVILIDSVKEFARLASTSLHRTQRAAIDPHAPATISFTSGTSGVPKAVVHSQRNLLWPGLISIDLEPPALNERIGTPLSLSIISILCLGPLSALVRGSTYVVMNRTYATGFCEDVRNHGVNRCFVVPTMLHDIVSDVSIEPSAMPSLDRVIVGGAGAEPALLWSFFDRFDVRPTLSYGLSEAPTGVVRESLDDPIGTGRGFPLPHVAITIRDAHGIEVPDGESGEVCLAPTSEGRWANTWSPTLGYLGEPDRTADLFRGWVLHTGDLGHRQDGALSVTGRLSSLIIRGGKNIDPSLIERQLTSNTLISEALAVAVPDERLGEMVGVLIVISDELLGDEFDSLDLVELAMGLEDEGVGPIDAAKVVPELPRNEMGKLNRNLPPDTFGPDNRLR